FGALKVFSTVVLSHLVGLQAAVVGNPSLAHRVVGGALLVYILLLTIVLLGTMAIVVLGLLIQLMRPDRTDEPISRKQAAQLDDTTRDRILDELAQVALLKALNRQTLSKLIQHMDHLTFDSGARIRRAGTPDQRLFWIQSGRVELMRMLPEGEEELAASLGPGRIFGEEGLMDQNAQYDSRAAEPTEVLCLDGSTLQHVVSDDQSGSEHVEQVLQLAAFLDEIPELAALGASGRLDLATQVSFRSFADGDDVVRQGDEAHSLFLVRSGRVAVWRTDAQGKEIVIAELGVGQTFGEIGLMFQKPRTATVTCLEDSQLVEVSKDHLEVTLKQSFHVGLALERLATRRMETVQ
ncbi:MAG: cyclic nucleotide-binding domain-containing protein, partial [Myxococcota bacterium]|nr:cyclic nucleotide-binding domain-containing protein [Myxococcota bacterium]